MSMSVPPPGPAGAPTTGRDGAAPPHPPADRPGPPAEDLDLARLNRMAASSTISAGDRASAAVAAAAGGILADPAAALAAQGNLRPDAVAWLLRP